MRPRLTYAQKSVLLQLVNHGDMQPPPTATTNAPSNPWRNADTRKTSDTDAMPSPRPAVARCKRTCHETPEHRLHLRQRTNRPLRDRTQAQDGGLQKAAGRFDHMDAEQSDELAEAYEQGKQAVFDAMNHFDELAIVERANPYRKDGR